MSLNGYFMQHHNSYQVCTRCVMDTSDPEISFNAQGHCNHCTSALQRLEQSYFPDERGQHKLEKLLDEIRQAGKGKPYDCLIGISGGIDSSWLTYKSKDWGLRPFIFHVDGGWNAEVAERNIGRLLDHLGYELHTYKVDWAEMRDVQRAYLESSLANQDVPQDHLFFAVLFHQAAQMGIKYWLSGSNLVSESILPRAWGYMAMDARQLKAIHKRFGHIPLRTFRTLSLWDCFKFYGDMRWLPSVKTVMPLNLMPYNTSESRAVLTQKVGWEYYGRKHAESRFTKFFQSYYLPEKFGYDKRRAHLSSLIVSGEITREQALEQLQEPLYDPDELREDKAFILEKLGYTEAQLDEIMARPNKTYRDYPSWADWLLAGKKIKGWLRKMKLVP